jgi:hypothetical protein
MGMKRRYPYHTIAIEFEVSFERRLDDESRAGDYTAKQNKYQHRLKQRNSFFEKRPLWESADNKLRAQRCHRSAFNARLANFE